MSKLPELLDGLDRRVGHRKLLEELLSEAVPGGASWAYVFGSSATILLLVQAVTGIVLAAYYSASATDAWASVAYLEAEISFGALVRGIHHHGAGIMIVMVGLHMIQVVLFGAYKGPREVNWLSGLALAGLVLAFGLTGYLLPWDQTGYWATKVATSIMGTVPIAGESIQRFAQGGNDYGNLTLTRFYALHVVVLPLITFALLGAHIALFRKHGVTPHPSKTPEELEARVDRFWPRQVAYDAAFGGFVVAVVLSVAVFLGAPLEAPADPATNFIARPEWYFLFLFQLLKYFEGPLQIVGTVILPGFAVTFLVALPFLDRHPSRAWGQRKPWLGALFGGFALVALLTGLAILADRKDPRIAEQRVVAQREAARARTLAARGVPAEGATYMMARDPLTRGERLFYAECASCHVLEGREPKEPKGPELTGLGSRAWIRQVLRDPDSPRLFGRTKVRGMKSFAHLEEADLQALVELVYVQRNPKAAPVEERPRADLLEEHECSNCHDFEEVYGLEGPTLFRYMSEAWLAGVLDDPGADHYYGDLNDMPAFAGRLSEVDRKSLVIFVMSLADRAPRDAWPFVDDPGPVPTPRARTATAAEGSE